MAMLTERQIHERILLKKAIETVTTVEPEQWAKKIHNRVRLLFREGLNIDEVIDDLKESLDLFRVITCTGGDNVSGWKDRAVRLSDKQQKQILAWMEMALRFGMKFDISIK